MSAAKKKLDTDQVASELSESAFFQPQTTNPQVGKTTSTQMDKPAKPLVEKYTTHLYPETIKAIRIYAAQHDMKDYEVAQMAFDLLLQEDEARPVAKNQETLSRASVEATLPLPDDLATLQAFADQHFVNRNDAERLRQTGAITAVKGNWTVGKQRVTVALDAKGRRDFWAQFHETPGFRACDDCPHSRM